MPSTTHRSDTLAAIEDFSAAEHEVFGFYQGSPQYPVQREFYNRTVSIGVRLNR